MRIVASDRDGQATVDGHRDAGDVPRVRLPLPPDETFDTPGQPAGLANSQDASFNHGSFLRVDEVVPTAAIGHGSGTVAPFAVRNRSILDVPVIRVSRVLAASLTSCATPKPTDFWCCTAA